MANTQFANYRFTVKEGEPSATGRNDAPISLMLEPMKGELSILSAGFLSLHIAPGTTMDEAQDLSRRLNGKISSVSFTKL